MLSNFYGFVKMKHFCFHKSLEVRIEFMYDKFKGRGKPPSLFYFYDSVRYDASDE